MNRIRRAREQQINNIYRTFYKHSKKTSSLKEHSTSQELESTEGGPTGHCQVTLLRM